MDVVVAGFDQGTRLTGVTVGSGAETPFTTAWRFDKIDPDDHGALGLAYQLKLEELYEAHRFTHAIFEAPFLDRHRDKVNWLRQRFGIDMLLQTYCEGRGAVCEESPFGHLKRELAGYYSADKDAMVAAAERAGFVLPKTKADGREDAADSTAAWLIGVRLYARRHLAAWDTRLYSRRADRLI